MRTALRIAAFLLVLTSLLNAEAPVKRILFISSYHPGFSVFFQQVDGIKEILPENRYHLDVEYLDSKRFPGPEHQKQMLAILRMKLAELPPYDGIISADDNALHLVVDHKQELFPDTPVVFFGVNDADFALRQNREPQITGYVEAVSIRETVAAMKQLFPKTERIVAISDPTTTGQSDLNHFYRIASSFPELEFNDLSLSDMTYRELEAALADLEEQDQILLLSAYQDQSGRTMSFSEYLSLIYSASKKPIFQLYQPGIGEGIFGGKVTNHRLQARAAAGTLQEVLSGERRIEDIPVREESPNRFEFDYDELIRFNIRLDELPEDSIIYGKPVNPFWQSQVSVIILAVILMIQAISIAYLIVVITKWRRDRRSLRLGEKRFESIFEYSPISLWEEDFSQVKSYLQELVAQGVEDIPGYIDTHPELAAFFAERIIIRDANRSAMEMNHIEHKADILGKLSKTLQPEEFPELLKEIKAMWLGETEKRWEISFPTPDGISHGEVSLALAPGSNEEWNEVYVSIQDITDRKQASQRLQAALEEKEILVKEIHHRVKNNLAIVTAFLHLSSLKSNNQETRTLFQDCEARVHSMARVHEGLYKSDDLRNIDLPLYLEENTTYLAELYQDPRYPMNLKVDAEALDLTIDELIPLGLLVTEAVTNAIKHGTVKDRTPQIDVQLQRHGDQAELCVADNGPGMGDIGDASSNGSLGLTLMNSLAEQLGGEMQIESDSSGTRILINFPYRIN